MKKDIITSLITTFFKKPKNTGNYINAKSECSECYQENTIRTMTYKAPKISSKEIPIQVINSLKQT